MNDIESLSELILEKWLGLTDAIPEHDEPDNDSSLAGPEQEYIFTQSFVFTPFPSGVRPPMANLVPYPFTHVATPVVEIVSPPSRILA